MAWMMGWMMAWISQEKHRGKIIGMYSMFKLGCQNLQGSWEENDLSMNWCLFHDEFYAKNVLLLSLVNTLALHVTTWRFLHTSLQLLQEKTAQASTNDAAYDRATNHVCSNAKLQHYESAWCPDQCTVQRSLLSGHGDCTNQCPGGK